ncbi:MAG: hypothetical protein EA411_13185 [Saprospirales bacterium]|nr:MAG: hypothetical protein EA411_13185 [Saprospirales bacterium]
MLIILIICTLLFAVSLPDAISQQQEQEKTEAENVAPNYYLGFTTNYFTIRSRRPFGWRGDDGRHDLPENRTRVTRSSFSMVLHFGYEFNETTHLGLFFDHRTYNRRTTLKIDSEDDERIPFSTNRAMYGFGTFARYVVNPQNEFQVYLRPSLGYYFDNYEEFRDSRRDYREDDRYISFGLGLGAQYEITDNLRLVLRLTGINYVNGKWTERGSDRGESYSNTTMNRRRSGMFVGFEWRL